MLEKVKSESWKVDSDGAQVLTRLFNNRPESSWASQNEPLKDFLRKNKIFFCQFSMFYILFLRYFGFLKNSPVLTESRLQVKSSSSLDFSDETWLQVFQKLLSQSQVEWLPSLDSLPSLVNKNTFILDSSNFSSLR